ncbi:hypothetical protein ScPMuIL_016972 [Solemya velum]
MGGNEREFADKLKRAVGSGDLTTIRRLVKGGVNVNAKFWYDSTLLHEAVSLGQLDVVKLLIQANADINATNEDRRSALHIAARAGHTDIISELLKNGSDANIQTLDGKTALHVAAWRGRQDVVHQLVEAGANVNLLDGDGWTALYWAAKLNYLDVVKLLVQHGAYLNCQVFKTGRTPLHEAVSKGYLKIVEYLIHEGADVSLTAKGESFSSLLLQNKHLTAQQVMKTMDLIINEGYNLHNDTVLKWNKLVLKLTNEKAYSPWLQDKQERVPPLSSLCRCHIRKQLSVCRRGKGISKSINKLPLPQIMLDFMLGNFQTASVT